MKKNYNVFPENDILSAQPGADKSAIVERYIKRHKSIKINPRKQDMI